MDLGDRAVWMILGGLIGFAVGYIVRALHEIKDKVADVDNHVVDALTDKKDNEEGFVRNPIVMDIALLVVVALTVWAAFASQRASNEITDTQRDLSRVSVCNQQYLSKTIAALNQTTSYTQARAEANVDLQRAQAGFLSVLLSTPPAADKARQQALKDYFTSLTDFVGVASLAKKKVDANPFPTNMELRDCLFPSSSTLSK